MRAELLFEVYAVVDGEHIPVHYTFIYQQAVDKHRELTQADTSAPFKVTKHFWENNKLQSVPVII